MSRGRALAARFRIRDWVRATIRDFHQWNRMLDALDLIGRNISDEIVRHPARLMGGLQAATSRTEMLKNWVR